MEVVYFTLGVFTVLSVIGVAIVIRMTIAVRQLQDDLKDHERGTQEALAGIYRDIDRETRYLQNQLDTRLGQFEK